MPIAVITRAPAAIVREDDHMESTSVALFALASATVS